MNVSQTTALQNVVWNPYNTAQTLACKTAPNTLTSKQENAAIKNLKNPNVSF